MQASNIPSNDLPAMDFGPCCACLKSTAVRNLVSLDRVAPLAGTGWGCVICGLPADGAMAVICDSCLDDRREVRWVIYGYAAWKGRIAIDAFKHVLFQHDANKHRGETK